MASAVVGLLLVTEPTVVTQFCEASPDFIMLAMLASGLSAFASGRYALTGFALLGMGLMNMRGVMAAVFLGSVMCIARYRDGGLTWRTVAKLALPSVVVFGAYYATYFAVNGWFFGESSNYSEHYAQPTSVAYVAKHVASLILRMLEQGRIIIWAGAAWLVLRLVVMGILAEIVAFGLLLWSVLGKIFGFTHADSGWTSIFVLVIFFGGLQLITTGIVGLYVGSIFDEVKRRPEYIIDTEEGGDGYL